MKHACWNIAKQIWEKKIELVGVYNYQLSFFDKKSTNIRMKLKYKKIVAILWKAQDS